MLPGLEQLVVDCAPQVAPVTMMAIVKVESGGNPLAINVNGPRRLARQPNSRAEALAWSQWLIGNGYSIDMGLTQVNSANFRKLGTNASAMIDPCANLAAGASILAGNYSGAASRMGGGQDALRAALSAYNTGNTRAGFSNGYVGKVAAAARAERRPARPAPTRTVAMTAGEASISPRVFWVRR